jgi:hypothetical protein
MSNFDLPSFYKVANVANNPARALWIPEGYEFTKTVSFSGTMKAVMMKSTETETMTISFSSLTPFFWPIDFLYKAWSIISDQELVVVEHEIKMNKFFNTWSEQFVDVAYSEIEKFFDDGGQKIVLTGMSMGGSMAQCFSYYLHAKHDIQIPVEVISFGAPRVGNEDLVYLISKWSSITNYAVVVDMSNGSYVDPAVHFPSSDKGYVNNPNIVMRQGHETTDKKISSYETNISFETFKKEWTFIPNSVLPAWNSAHQYWAYMQNL